MGRHVGRSRGCQVCRKRKIKCDEKVPECSQCMRSGKACPGPLEGTLFLDASTARARPTVRDNKPRERRASRITAASRTPTEANDSRESGNSHLPESSQTPGNQYASALQRTGGSTPESQLPSFYQPSRSPAFQELFLDHFIQVFFDPRCERNRASEWSLALSTFLQNHEQTASIVHAIRAATMAHYGKISGDVSIQMDSMRWYSKSIENQRHENIGTQQKLAEGSDVGNVFKESIVATPIMLMFFETVMGTTPVAWAQHLKAASLMMEMVGPWKCRQGIFHHIFKCVRIGAVYMGVTWEKETIFASDEWCTIPFLDLKKTTSDRINDVLLKIPECMDLNNTLRNERKQGSPSVQATTQNLERKALWLKIRLEEYWKEYGDEIDADYTWEQYREESDFKTDAKAWVLTAPQPVRFRNKVAATLIPDYDAGIVIVYSILREVCMDTVPEYLKRIAIHCASILEAVAFLQKLGIDSGGNTSLVFPLKTASLCTPSRQQEYTSATDLAKWGKTRGLEGICEIWKSHSEEGPRNAGPSIPL